MKTTSFCALCAAFAVPALVQPAMADEKLAQEYVDSLAELQGAMVDVYQGIDTDEITPDEAADLIDQLTAALDELFSCERDEETQAQIVALVEAHNDDFVKIEEGVLKLLQNLKAANYLESDKLKAACEKYAEFMELEL